MILKYGEVRYAYNTGQYDAYSTGLTGLSILKNINEKYKLLEHRHISTYIPKKKDDTVLEACPVLSISGSRNTPVLVLFHCDLLFPRNKQCLQIQPTY